jgi:hypothetical protein
MKFNSYKIIFLSILFLIILPNITRGEDALKGKILLQVESNGQAWYVNPADEKRYGLGNPNDAFLLMQKLGIGISDDDLAKIPVGIMLNNYADSDSDGLYDGLEDAIGSDKNNKDTDGDGYEDKLELNNGYDPIGAGKLPINNNFTLWNSGKIFLQVEKKGEAWYVEPTTQKRYLLRRPAEALQLMQNLGLGISNANIAKIPIGFLTVPKIPNTSNDPSRPATENILESAAAAIKNSDTRKTLSYFTPNMQKSIEYSMQKMNKENLLVLANILSGSFLQSSSDNKKTYANEVYFQDKKHTVFFYVERQADGNWKITNL